MKVTVPVKSSWTSKINWTQLIAVMASVLVLFGISIPAETQLQIVVGIQAAQAIATWIIRTWFTKEITAASV